jgi:hypothetical protein
MDTFAYERIDESTWMYLSSFLILAIFFKFNRAWSIRNLDLFLVVMLAPGLLLIQSGRFTHTNYLQSRASTVASASTEARETAGAESDATQTANDGEQEADNEGEPSTSNESVEGESNGVATKVANDAPALEDEDSIAQQPGVARQRYGYFWMFGIAGLYLIRLLLDPMLERRPILEPNLSVGGMVFMGISLMFFVLANIATSTPAPEDLEGARNAVKMLQREAAPDSEDGQLLRRGPGIRIVYIFPVISTFETSAEIQETRADEAVNIQRYVIAAKTLAITSQVLIVLGLILFCYYNYGNFNIGVGIAMIYMLLPYTAMYTGNILHSVPAMLLIWALVSFRIPFVSGLFIGLATGATYYPLFLLPLWISFYWERGFRRFLSGFSLSMLICIMGLLLTSADSTDFLRQLQAMFGFWRPMMTGLEGIWALGYNQWWRLPLLISFVVLSVSFASWPIEKNIGTLVAYTAVVMAAVQFWHGFGGGLYVAWYLPIALLVFFRPNLSGRVATEEVNPFKIGKREVAEAETES